jgi:protein-disulfide isomerase
MKDENITMKKSTIWQVISGVLAILLIVSIYTGGFGKATGATVADNKPIVPSGVALVSADDFVDDDAVLGNKNAPVTIIEFSDYQCPYCRKFWAEAYSQIKEEYIDTGKVKLIFRDFPLSFHPMAEPSAQAAECAGDQGKYYEMHDKIFSEQNKLGTGTIQYSINDLKQWAVEIGLDASEFNACLDSGKHKLEVQKDLADAQAAGGQGTPYFIVGDTPISGAQPFSVFQQAIESQL